MGAGVGRAMRGLICRSSPLVTCHRLLRLRMSQQCDIVAERSDDELQAMTINDWLNYFLRLPAYAVKRKALFTDQQYIDLLHQCLPGALRVSVQMKGVQRRRKRGCMDSSTPARIGVCLCRTEWPMTGSTSVLCW